MGCSSPPRSLGICLALGEEWEGCRQTPLPSQLSSWLSILPQQFTPAKRTTTPGSSGIAALQNHHQPLKKKNESWAEQGFRLPQPALAPAITGGVQC